MGNMLVQGAAGRPSFARRPPPRLPFAAYLRLGTERMLNWTPLREKVLYILWQTQKPWGAYDIAGELGLFRASKNAVSMYRILAILEEAALVLPIVVRKRFMISPDPHLDAWGVMLCARCDDCSAVALPAEAASLRRSAERLLFKPRRITLECVGTCARCSGGRNEAWE